MWDFLERVGLVLWFFARRMFGQLINGPLVKSLELFTRESEREREKDIILDIYFQEKDQK